MNKPNKDQNSKANNLVAKHARTFNKAAVMVDRKKAFKAGKRKYKSYC